MPGPDEGAHAGASGGSRRRSIDAYGRRARSGRVPAGARPEPGRAGARAASGAAACTAALAQLPERQRLVFMLSHYEGRSSREVSAMTGSTSRRFACTCSGRFGACGRCSPEAPRQRSTSRGRINSCGSLILCFVSGHLVRTRAGRGGARPASVPSHLDRCDICAERAVRARPVARRRRERRASTTADAAFPPERLAAQQAQILRRLEQLDQPARVIAFPAQSPRRAMRRVGGRRVAGLGRRGRRRGPGARRRRRPAESRAWRAHARPARPAAAGADRRSPRRAQTDGRIERRSVARRGPRRAHVTLRRRGRRRRRCARSR